WGLSFGSRARIPPSSSSGYGSSTAATPPPGATWAAASGRRWRRATRPTRGPKAYSPRPVTDERPDPPHAEGGRDLRLGGAPALAAPASARARLERADADAARARAGRLGVRGRAARARRPARWDPAAGGRRPDRVSPARGLPG